MNPVNQNSQIAPGQLAEQDCHSFQAQLPELFDTDAGLIDHPHLADCKDCAALVRDLEYIAAQAKLLLPLHDPSPAVWNNIQSALSQPEEDGTHKNV